MLLSTSLTIALLALSMSGTPGPNNVMLLASGVNYGFRRTLPHILGIRMGFTILFVCSGLGLGALLLAEPRLHLAIKVAGGACLLWIAWKTAMSRGMREATVDGKPMTLLQALVFQCVNPKAWVSALSMTIAFVHPASFVHDMIMTYVIFSSVALFSTCSWAGMGTVLKNWLSDPVRLKWFNITMALLLVASLWPMLR
jgi:threonine/homoserine/homoserine lactone efflux protein